MQKRRKYVTPILIPPIDGLEAGGKQTDHHLIPLMMRFPSPHMRFVLSFWTIYTAESQKTYEA